MVILRFQELQILRETLFHETILGLGGDSEGQDL